MSTVVTKLPTAARVLLGLAFFVFGLNGFLGFLPAHAPHGTAAAFLGGLAASGYFFPLLKGTEVIAGALLLSGRIVPFALVLLAPIVVNIAAFHLALDASGLGVAFVVVALEAFLGWTHRAAFAPLF